MVKNMTTQTAERMPYLQRVYADLHSRRFLNMPLRMHMAIGNRCYPSRRKKQKTRLVRFIERRGGCC